MGVFVEVTLGILIAIVICLFFLGLVITVWGLISSLFFPSNRGDKGTIKTVLSFLLIGWVISKFWPHSNQSK